MTKIFNYDLTNQIYNSDSIAAKIAKYSLIGIALVTIVETIKNIVLSPFRIISNLNNSSIEVKKDKKIEPLEKQVSSPSKFSKELEINNQQKRNWKKIAIGTAIIVLGIAAVSKYYFSPAINGLTSEQLTVKDSCENLFSKSFNGRVACNEYGWEEVKVPGMDPSKYTLVLDESSHSFDHTTCTAVLTKEGRASIQLSDTCREVWKIRSKGITLWWDWSAKAWY